MSDLPATHELTKIEREILHAKANGLSYKEIARKRQRSLGTIKNEMHNIMWKLDARSIAQAAVKAWFQGLIH